MPKRPILKYRRQETEDEVVARIAAMTGESASVVRIFARISAPENRHLFTKETVLKAFAKVDTTPHAPSVATLPRLVRRETSKSVQGLENPCSGQT